MSKTFESVWAEYEAKGVGVPLLLRTDIVTLAAFLAQAVQEYPDFDGDNKDEPRPLVALAKQLEAACEAVQAQPVADAVQGDGSFFNLNGINATPDIEEDVGRLLVELNVALDFIKNGPVINMPAVELDKMFDERVWSLIPRVQTLIANRIMAKHPFAVLADLFSQGGMPKGTTGSQRYVHGVGKMLETCDAMARVNPKTDAVEVMDCLAYMATYMQVIMNLYGWSWDDVKLKARQQMVQSESVQAPAVV